MLALPLLLACAAPVLVQDDARLARARTLDDHHPFTPPALAADWEAARARLRRQVRVAAGLWPFPERAPLEAVVHGAIERDGYRVEKVFFQAHAGLWVTGNLYRPAGASGPFPAVLCPHGHWAEGRFTTRTDGEVQEDLAAGRELFASNARFHLQARCAHLARMGCVVLHYDMLGYADSRELDHRRGFGDADAELWSLNHLGLQTWSSIRALDFLETLPDVDPRRIAVTGGSGGGTQTFLLCAVDDRPALAVPAVMVSTRMQGGCVCENASHLRVDAGNVHFAALTAPRPLFLTGANDWTLDIERDGLPQLRALYAELGAPDAVDGKCYPEFPHNYNHVSRAAMYAWVARWFELGEPLPEAELVPVPPARLSVFDDAHPRPEALDVAGLRASLRARFEAELAARRPRDAASLEEFRRLTGGALEALLHTGLPRAGEVLEVLEEADGLVLSRGDGDRVAVTFTPPASSDGVLFVVVQPPEPLPIPTLPAGAGLLVVRPLSGPLPVDGGRHGQHVAYTWGYNRTLLAWRVHDVLTAIGCARTRARTVRLVGLGDAGPWALLAGALARPALASVSADWDSEFDSVAALDDPSFLPGAARHGGLDAFAALLAPLPLALRGAPGVPTVQAAYAAAGATSALSRGHESFIR